MATIYMVMLQSKKYKNEEVIANQFSNSFKRELIFEEDGVYPTGYGIPENIIMDIDYPNKTQLHQGHIKIAKFEDPIDLGGNKAHHIFNDEMSILRPLKIMVWFDVYKRRVDSLRHYEKISPVHCYCLEIMKINLCFVLHKNYLAIVIQILMN